MIFAGFLAGLIIFHRPAQVTRTAETGLHEHSVEETAVWTCAMHPHIRMEKPGQCPICGMDLIPLQASSVQADDDAIEMSESAIRLAEVQTAVVTRGSLLKEVHLYGKIQVDERSLRSQSAHFPGRIEQLMVNVTGDHVRRGQLLARVYSPEIITAQKELIEALKLRDKYPELVEAAREKLKNWKLTEEQVNNIEKTGNITQVFEVFANTSGIVLNRRVSEGDYIARGAILFDIADLSAVWGVFDAYESDLPWISLNQSVEFTAGALPGKTFKGKVSFINPVINPATRTAQVRVDMNNPGMYLKPEMFINGTLHSSLNGSGGDLVIPNSAVLWTGRRSIVYVRMPESVHPSFKMREITLGASMKDTYIVIDGLAEGEEIVVNGTFSVDAAAQLAGKPSMMNPESGPAMTGHDHGGTAITGSTTNNEQTGSREIAVTRKPDQISSELKSQLTKVYEAYLKIKDAFVASNVKIAGEEAIKARNTLDAVDMVLVKGDAHTIWMQHLKTLRHSISSIAGSSDIEAQRAAFSDFSNQLYITIKTFGLQNKTVHYQFCPMAFGDKGAYWLSETEAIRNPYFGDAMLRCGETKETLTFTKKDAL